MNMWEHVNFILTSRNINRKDFCDKMGITPGHLSFLIQGKRGSSDKLKDKAAKYLGFTIAELMSEDFNEIHLKKLIAAKSAKLPDQTYRF